MKTEISFFFFLSQYAKKCEVTITLLVDKIFQPKLMESIILI